MEQAENTQGSTFSVAMHMPCTDADATHTYIVYTLTHAHARALTLTHKRSVL